MFKLIILVIVGIFFIVLKNNNWDLSSIFSFSESNKSPTEPESDMTAYQKKWMFSYNEKDAFFKLKAIADECGYFVFAKVRLFDLLEPTKNHPKKKTNLYKIQAKHVDFVICDSKLVARCIVELDDNSHKSEVRKERDQFVDSVLEGVGYTVIHTLGINDSVKEQIVEAMK